MFTKLSLCAREIFSKKTFLSLFKAVSRITTSISYPFDMLFLFLDSRESSYEPSNSRILDACKYRWNVEAALGAAERDNADLQASF